MTSKPLVNPAQQQLRAFLEELQAGVMPDVVQLMLAISAVSDLYPNPSNPLGVDFFDTDCPDGVVCPRC